MDKYLRAKIDGFLPVETLLKRFETKRACRNEKKLRIRALAKSSDYTAIVLIEKLSDCTDEEPCSSLACPECIRRLRVKMISQLALFCEDYTEWKFATFIYYDQMVPELEDLDIARLKDKFRKQLQRSGVTDIAIGCFEVDYHPEYQHWMPHFHLLVRCQNSYSKEWRKVRKIFKEQQIPSDIDIRKRRPVLFQRFKNPLRQVAYICKFMWQQVEAYYDGSDNRKTKKTRLQPNNFVSSLLMLDSLRLSDLEFMYGVKRYGAKLRETVRDKK
ncbi:hypothetical protein [Aeromonas salmonicida]|uniref:hypothetical protein n=1 Tax=Aeromonas salmonicida TaxID=645 RepID=UPI00283AAFE2|nr:hypothetical protein [Aeromonas salmonicida]